MFFYYFYRTIESACNCIMCMICDAHGEEFKVEKHKRNNEVKGEDGLFEKYS